MDGKPTVGEFLRQKENFGEYVASIAFASAWILSGKKDATLRGQKGLL